MIKEKKTEGELYISTEYELQGKVRSLRRKEEGSFSSIDFFIDTEDSHEKFNLPIHTENDAELIPYQIGLEGQEVYIKQTFSECAFAAEPPSNWFSMKVLSGPLKDRNYNG